MTVADSPMANDAEGSGSIHFCNLCNKPITSESAFKRHVAYCRRTAGKPKKRKRSCKQCHRAKAKCSFELQCSRCTSKGFICEYEKLVLPLGGNETSNDAQDASASEPSGSSPSDCTGSPGYASTEMPGFEGITTLSELQINTPPRSVTELRTDPKHQASALFLLEYIRALPSMLSRRWTFPAFIHGQWHEPELPIKFANCSHISQLWLVRNTNPQGREIFYSAMEEESTRLMFQLENSTKEELTGRLALQNIYALLAVIDSETPQANFVPELEVRKRDIDRVTRTARQCFALDAYAPFDIDTIGDPNETWEEFIYAESRRRCALFWFIVSRVVYLNYGSRCPPVLGYRGLSLPAPEALWRATTRKDWKAARAEALERCQTPLHGTTLRTVGDLIDCRAGASDPNREREVSNWLASSDKLGLLLVVASTMV
ncbi:hypothetical protein F4859DRAFT_508909 [Xylaria cf. heliscus]|nr:hypothetical protein F4859DRAFT_508909 [Xylaria cf. heliscus]